MDTNLMKTLKRVGITLIITAIAYVLCVLYVDKPKQTAAAPVEENYVLVIDLSKLPEPARKPEVLVGKVTRHTDYGVDNSHPITVWSHRGGKVLNYTAMRNTTKAVLRRMPNIRSTDAMVNLVVETMIVETRLGGSSYAYAAKNYRNYGIAQIREDTAEDTLDWLKGIRPDVYTAVKALYNKKLTMRENLMTNVPFSIAVCAQYYWRRDVNIQQSAATVASRAKLWKVHYNTAAGAGTVDKYIERVYAFNK